MNDARPHTISGSAHHQRPALSAYTFQPDSSIDKTPVVSPQDDYAHVPDVPSRDMHKSYIPTSLKTLGLYIIDIIFYMLNCSRDANKLIFYSIVYL